MVCKYISLNLKKYCDKIICLNFGEDLKIKNFIEKIKNKENLEILIGSGFSEHLSLQSISINKFDRGNTIKKHKLIRSQKFFQELKKYNINIPRWSLTKPFSKKCLVKDFQSYGGYMVFNHFSGKNLKESEYYQEEIIGEHISVQFFCDKLRIKVLSICNQYFKEDNLNPFIIETIVSKKVDLKIFERIKKICNLIGSLFELNGINNLDLVLQKKTKKIFVIELNARPGLSTNMIYKIYNNIYKNTFSKKSLNSKFSFGTKIVYSNKRIIIEKKNFEFIESLGNNNSYSELPVNNQIIKINEPICLIHKKSKKVEILREKLEKMSYKIIKNLN